MFSNPGRSLPTWRVISSDLYPLALAYSSRWWYFAVFLWAASLKLVSKHAVNCTRVIDLCTSSHHTKSGRRSGLGACSPRKILAFGLSEIGSGDFETNYGKLTTRLKHNTLQLSYFLSCFLAIYFLEHSWHWRFCLCWPWWFSCENLVLT